MLIQIYERKCAPNYSRIDEGDGAIPTMDAFLSWTKDDTILREEICDYVI